MAAPHATLPSDDERAKLDEKFYPLEGMPDRRFATSAVLIVAEQLQDLLRAWLPVLRLNTPSAVTAEPLRSFASNIFASELTGLLGDEILDDLRSLSAISELCTGNLPVNLSGRKFAHCIDKLHILRPLERIATDERPDLTARVVRLNLGNPRDRLRMAARVLTYSLHEHTVRGRTSPFARFNSNGVTSNAPNMVPQSEVDTQYREALQNFEVSVEAGLRLSRGAGGIPSSTASIFWASVLFTRLCNFAVSISRLLPGSSYSHAHSDELWDSSAVSALSRSVFECFLLFYYIGIEETSPDEMVARIKMMYLHDCTMRLRIFYKDDVADTDQAFYAAEQARLQAELLANPFFGTLTAKRQTHFLRGRELFFYTQDEVLGRMKLNPSGYRRYYELLSAHTHSLPGSFYGALHDGRGRGVENEAEKRNVAQAIRFAGELLGAATSIYRDLFPDLDAEGSSEMEDAAAVSP